MTSQRETGLIDGFGRRINYLRLSVTDRCDFRCVYCMNEQMEFLPRNQVLSLEELITSARIFTELGVNKIRLTGGEPLVRSGIVDLCQAISQLPGLNELAITTNGSQLETLAYPLQQAGVQRLNISLDTLDAARFSALSRRNRLAQVIRGIDAAIDAGFSGIKLNCVILKGQNDDEILPLTEFALQRQIDITFIEEMPLGAMQDRSRASGYLSSDAVMAVIGKHYPLVASTYSSGGPARYFGVSGRATRIGFISPHSHNFCDSCNRLRLTVEGQLLLCLGNERSLDLKTLLRSAQADPGTLKQQIRNALQNKPLSHTFVPGDDLQIVRFMNMTGG